MRIFIFPVEKNCYALVISVPCTPAILRHEATGLIVINPDTTDSVSTLSNSSPVNERKQKAKLFYNGAS